MKRKGVTPVIAVVLLLLITVGAVGMVYTQIGDLLEGQADTSFLESTDVDMNVIVRNTTHGDDPGQMQVRFENTGDEEYNLSEAVRLEYSVSGESRLPAAEADFADGLFNRGLAYEPEEATCLTTEELGSFGPGERSSCNTGVDMPSPGDSVEIHLVETGSGEEVTSRSCSPSTSSSSTC